MTAATPRERLASAPLVQLSSGLIGPSTGLVQLPVDLVNKLAAGTV